MSITVGVIGCGSISKFHFAGLKKVGARVKWVCDLSESAARPWAEKFGADWTPDYRRVLEDPQVQAVFVLTISATHKMICLDAIQAGKAVVCEKTLAENAQDALEIVQAARSKGTIFYTSYMKRFIPAVEQAKALLPSLGKIISTHVRSYQPWGDLWESNPGSGFFHCPPDGKSQVVGSYGGGILVCGGSHMLDLVGFFQGRPVRLYASMFQPEDRDYDLLASALIETKNGVAHFEVVAHPLEKIGFLRDGWDERIEINGTQGRLELYSALWDQVTWKDSYLVHYDNHSGTSTEYRFGAVSPFEREVSFFCDNIQRGEQGTQSIFTGYDVDELIAAIQRSAMEHRAVDMHWRIGNDQAL